MKVSYYSSKTNVVPTKNITIYKALEDIRTGVHQDQVNKARVYFLQNKKMYDLEKGKLPLIGWSGTFTSRANDNLIDFSGYASLDFDKITDLDSLIKKVNKDKYTFASFVTPSGHGLKALVKIPFVGSDKDYKSFYSELQKRYNTYEETDESTKDISRASFVSYDPNLYLNADSEMFTDRFIPKEIFNSPVDVKITDMGDVANRLLTWFSKKWSTGKERNNNLFMLCAAFNDYGVDKSIATDYCMSYVTSDFKDKEIESLINSAYKRSENFGVKAFEDTGKKTLLRNMVFSGATKEHIKKQIDVSDKCIEDLEKEIPEDIFWEITDRGKIKISFFRFDRYLKKKGISKYFQDNESPSFDFIVKDDNFINWIDQSRIKDAVKVDLLERGCVEVWDYMAANSKIFTKESLSMLDTINVDYKKDTKKTAFVYYQNHAVKITSKKVELINYDDIEDLVWQKQVIDRDIVLKDKSEGIFKKFIWLVSGQSPDRYYTLKSVIGYLMHSYQNDAKPKVVVFNDEMLSDDVPNGGSGKGLIHKAISYIKNVVVEDGKRFDPKTQFAYQSVNKDTQIFLLDDVSKGFNFENLFSAITNGITVEKKGKDSFQIPFNESPKISITTNYTIKGDGPSHNRRVFEVELANYFNDVHTPEDEFGHQFFNQWDDTEWQKFDNFMIRCVQYFLKNGLVESDKVNLALRKLRNNLGIEFLEYMESLSLEDYTVSRKELRDTFLNQYKELARYNSAQVFNKKVKDYCEFYEIDLTEAKNGGVIKFIFKRNNEQTTEEKEELEKEF